MITRKFTAATLISAALLAGAGTAAADTGPAPVRPVASPAENLAAQQAFLAQFGTATAVGGFAGTVAGAVIGCIVTIPLGCLPGLVTGAGVGGVLGTIIVGGPALAVTGVELIQTLNAAPGTTKYAPTPAQ